MNFVSCPEQGLKTEGACCPTQSQGFLEYFSFPKQGQDFQPSVAPLCPNTGQVPSEGCRMLFMIILMLLPLCCTLNEVDNVIPFLVLLCLAFTPIQIFFSKIYFILLLLTVKMIKISKGLAVFVAITFLFLIVLYTSQSNERTRVTIPQTDTRRSFVSSTSEVTAYSTTPRLNVILLTHMRSGSTVVRNMFTYS